MPGDHSKWPKDEQSAIHRHTFEEISNNPSGTMMQCKQCSQTRLYPQA